MAHCEAHDIRPSELLRQAVEKFIDANSCGFRVDGVWQSAARRVGGPSPIITGTQLQERMTMDSVRPRPVPGSRLKIKK